MAHTLIGTVTSDKRDKTITVSIVSRETHPLYRKQYTKTRKYTAHDAKNEAHLGDRVQIEETAPISKTKTYKLVKILERSHGTVELKEDVEKVELPEKKGADEIAREMQAGAEVAEEIAKAQESDVTAEKISELGAEVEEAIEEKVEKDQAAKADETETDESAADDAKADDKEGEDK